MVMWGKIYFAINVVWIVLLTIWVYSTVPFTDQLLLGLPLRITQLLIFCAVVYVVNLVIGYLYLMSNKKSS